MSNIDKRALREAAEKATGAHDRLSVMPADDIFDISLHEGTQLDADITDLNSFNEAANPATVLALLDELEAKDKLIDTLRQDKDKVIDMSKERISKLLACVAELEARTLVPVEPTLDQLVAGKRRLTSTGRMSRLMSQRLAEVYRAMVNAAAAGKGE